MSRIKQVSAVVLILVASACDGDRKSPLNEITAPPSAQVQSNGFAAPSGIVTVA